MDPINIRQAVWRKRLWRSLKEQWRCFWLSMWDLPNLYFSSLFCRTGEKYYLSQKVRWRACEGWNGHDARHCNGLHGCYDYLRRSTNLFKFISQGSITDNYKSAWIQWQSLVTGGTVRSLVENNVLGTLFKNQENDFYFYRDQGDVFTVFCFYFQKLPNHKSLLQITVSQCYEAPILSRGCQPGVLCNEDFGTSARGWFLASPPFPRKRH